MDITNIKRAFIIAEIGINHDGSLQKLLKMIDVAKVCGVDAVKLQVMTGYDLIAGYVPYTFGKNGNKSTVDLARMFYERRVRKEWLPQIYKFCKNKDITCLATPFSEETVDWLEEAGNLIYKISSGDLTHLPLIDYVAQKGKALILSTGKSTLADVDEAVRTIKNRKNSNFALLHCVSSYPTPYNQLNLNIIDTLKNSFLCTVGFSDHSEGYISSVAAVCKGAMIIEKHFTLNKTDFGPDHWFSLDPSELKLLVDNIRLVEKTFGTPEKKLAPSEEKSYLRPKRSIVAVDTIYPGEIITREKLTYKRPGIGIKPKYIDFVCGKISKKKYRKDDFIRWDDFN